MYPKGLCMLLGTKSVKQGMSWRKRRFGETLEVEE